MNLQHLMKHKYVKHCFLRYLTNHFSCSKLTFGQTYCRKPLGMLTSLATTLRGSVNLKKVAQLVIVMIAKTSTSDTCDCCDCNFRTTQVHVIVMIDFQTPQVHVIVMIAKIEYNKKG